MYAWAAAIPARAAAIYSLSQVDIETGVGTEEFASVSLPAVKTMYPVVDFLSSVQSWNDASENTTICDGLMLYFSRLAFDGDSVGFL